MSESPHSLTIGFDVWLRNTIVVRNWFLLGPSGRAAVLSLRPQMNFFTLLWLGLEIRIHGLERRVRRAKDWRDLLRIVEPYWFWMAWRRSNTRMVHKRDG